jgi:hypothetical protein
MEYAWMKGSCNFFLDLQDTEDVLVDEVTKRSWLNKTLMSCKNFEPVLSNIGTTETTMLALQGDSGNATTRLPWAIWLKRLKDKAKTPDKKQKK